MKKGIAYLFLQLTLSYLLFWVLEGNFGTNNHMIAYLLAMIVTHFILEKNHWLAELLYKSADERVIPESQTTPVIPEIHHNSKITNIKKKSKNNMNFSEIVHTVHVGENFNINYNKNRYLIRQNKNGYILTRESDGYTQVFKSVDDLFSKGKIENKLVKDVIIHQENTQKLDEIIVR